MPANGHLRRSGSRKICVATAAKCGSKMSPPLAGPYFRSEEHTSELQSLMRTSYAVLCLKKKNTIKNITTTPYTKKHTTNTEQPITNKTTNHISQNKHNITNHNTPVTILK